MPLIGRLAIGVLTLLTVTACNPNPNDHLDPDQDDIADQIDTDFDGDGIVNVDDQDDDNDGIYDSEDAFPFDPNEQLDTDDDGIGNNQDTDDDNDGVIDTEDTYPLDSSEWRNNDGDALGDNFDRDDDNDGVDDTDDAFPLDASETLDFDTDGIGNNADPDDDNDGVNDILDAFPFDASEWANFDGDLLGDNADLDDDNDGTPDATDAFPLNASESSDFDEDNIGDNTDTDDDNDGFNDTVDVAPKNALQSTYPTWEQTTSNSWETKTLYHHERPVLQFEIGFIDDDALLDIALLTDNALIALLQQPDNSFLETTVVTSNFLTEFKMGNVDSDIELEFVTVDQLERTISKQDIDTDNVWTATEIDDGLGTNTIFEISDTDFDGKNEIFYHSSIDSRFYFNQFGSSTYNYYCEKAAINSARSLTLKKGQAPKLLHTDSSGRIYYCDREKHGTINSQILPNIFPTELIATDLDANGESEIMVVGGQLTVLEQTTSTYDAAFSLAEGEEVYAAAVENLIGDRRQEIAYISESSRELILLSPNSADTQAYDRKVISEDLTNSANIQILDWSNDGNLDILTSSDAKGIQVHSPPKDTHLEYTLSGEVYSEALLASDSDGNALTYRLLSSFDATYFSLDSETGVLESVGILDAESPDDEDGDNHYLFTVAVSDGHVEVTRDIELIVIP